MGNSKTKNIQRSIYIENCLHNHLPNDIVKLISTYDYYLQGKFRTLRPKPSSQYNKITNVAILPDGRIVASIDCYNICIWNPQTELQEHRFHATNCSTSCIYILSNGKIITASLDGTVNIWNIEQDVKYVKCEYTKRFYRYTKYIGILSDGSSGCCFAAERMIIAYSHDFAKSTLKICNLQTGICDTTFELDVDCVTIFPDGRIVTKNKINEICI